MPVALIGTTLQQKPNFMAVGWISRVNAAPPLIGVGIYKEHYTVQGIAESTAFSACLPSADMVELTDYCGIISGRSADKSSVFDIFYGDTGSPLIRQCPLCIDCRLYQTVELPSNVFFIGEIVGVYTEEQYLAREDPDFRKIDPLLLTMPDNNYWTLGKSVGRAWKSGKGLRNVPRFDA